MANAVYDKAREEYLDGVLDWGADDVRVCLVKSGYTFSAAHTSMADIGTNDNGRSAALGSKTVTNGVADSADTSVIATTTAACSALVVYKHTGSDATARLITYIDTPTSGLPFTPVADQTVNVAWDNGPNKIFKL